MRCEAVPAEPALLARIAENMRAPDVAEVWAAARLDPLTALEWSVGATSEAWVALVDGEPACAWGISRATVLSDAGHPWLLGTPLLDAHPLRVLRVSRRYLSEVRDQYSYLVNYVDARNEKAVQWLGWLGFTLDPPAPWGIGRVPFHRFHWGAA